MSSNRNRRLLMLAVAVAGSALLQACAVTTGGFVPSRSENLNHSVLPTYRNESFHLRTAPATPHSLMQTAPEKGGFHDFVYY